MDHPAGICVAALHLVAITGTFQGRFAGLAATLLTIGALEISLARDWIRAGRGGLGRTTGQDILGCAWELVDQQIQWHVGRVIDVHSQSVRELGV
jgi:hypothetical protein